MIFILCDWRLEKRSGNEDQRAGRSPTRSLTRLGNQMRQLRRENRLRNPTTPNFGGTFSFDRSSHQKVPSTRRRISTSLRPYFLSLSLSILLHRTRFCQNVRSQGKSSARTLTPFAPELAVEEKERSNHDGFAGPHFYHVRRWGAVG
jgi:hypothetical protein